MSKPNWITVTPASGSNNGSFDVVAAENVGADRSGIITVDGGGVSKTINVEQNSGIFQIKSILLTGQFLRPVTIKQDSRKFKLGGTNPARVDIPYDINLVNFTVEIEYDNSDIGSGGTNIQFITNDGVSEIIPTGDLQSYINFKANDTGFIIICGNGFIPIPIANKYTVSFKNSSGTTTYGFNFYCV